MTTHRHIFTNLVEPQSLAPDMRDVADGPQLFCPRNHRTDARLGVAAHAFRHYGQIGEYSLDVNRLRGVCIHILAVHVLVFKVSPQCGSQITAESPGALGRHRLAPGIGVRYLERRGQPDAGQLACPPAKTLAAAIACSRVPALAEGKIVRGLVRHRTGLNGLQYSAEFDLLPPYRLVGTAHHIDDLIVGAAYVRTVQVE